jgi:hypothetical protein
MTSATPEIGIRKKVNARDFANGRAIHLEHQADSNLRKIAELVWSKPSNPDSHESTNSPESGTLNAKLDPRQFTALEKKSGVNKPQSTQSHTLILNTATIDKLAEDVIRRVERRFQIERERRGI